MRACYQYDKSCKAAFTNLEIEEDTRCDRMSSVVSTVETNKLSF